MTVKENRVSSTAVEFDQGPARGKLAAAVGGKAQGAGDVETDTESWGSSAEEGESPRSVAMWRRRKVAAAGCLHSQVLRVMEEDMHLGEDIVAGLGGGAEYGSEKLANGVVNGGVSHGDHQIVIFSRRILPCSPLSRKGSTVIKTVH